MKKDNKGSLIKKEGSLVKFDPGKKKELVVRGLDELDLQKIILYVGLDSGIHKLFDKEIR